MANQPKNDEKLNVFAVTVVSGDQGFYHVGQAQYQGGLEMWEKLQRGVTTGLLSMQKTAEE